MGRKLYVGNLPYAGTRKGVNPNLVFILQFLFRLSQTALSGLAIYLGYRLFILGVTGEASLSIESKGISGQLLNAAPGLFFAVGGITALTLSIWKGWTIRFREAPAENAFTADSEAFGLCETMASSQVVE